jgi:acetyl-CoA C-acetyltransferase
MAGSVIVAGARTPIGKLSGALAGFTAMDLGGFAIRAALQRSGLKPEEVDYVFMGQVIQAGQGQITSRQAAVKAGIPMSVPCTTINKVCLSGLNAIYLADLLINAGDADVVVAGGMESMTNSPYLLPKARGGYRLGHGEIKDHMFLDGLEDAYEHKLMGTYAEDTARHYQFTRSDQDAFATESLLRAKRAQQDGSFAAEIVAVKVKGKGGEAEVSTDEQPRRADPAKIPTLKPAFSKDGTVTAANSSSISDGAAALVLARADFADKHSLKPIARIVAQASHAQEPRWFTTAPVGAVEKVLAMTGWNKDDVDLFEINEAFANVAMVAMRDLSLPHDKVNVNGGACALGHPIGASGARIIVTLLNALERRGGKRGIASLCIGGGEGTAVAIERL